MYSAIYVNYLINLIITLYLHIKHLTSLDCNYSWKLLSLGHSGPAGERFLDIFLSPESQLLEFAGGLFFDKYLVYIIYFS